MAEEAGYACEGRQLLAGTFVSDFPGCGAFRTFVGWGRDKHVTPLHQSLEHAFFLGTCRPLPLQKATEARGQEGCSGALGLSHRSDPMFLISLGPSFSCVEWAH